MHLNGENCQCHLKGKTCRKLANGQDIDYSEENNGDMASSAPLLGLFSIIDIQRISGERLQDHWSSGYLTVLKIDGAA